MNLLLQILFWPFNAFAALKAKFGMWSPYPYKDRTGFRVSPGGRESICYEADGKEIWIVATYAASPVEVLQNADGSLDVERSTGLDGSEDWQLIVERLRFVCSRKWRGELKVRGSR
jgi:hypothetical protein